MVLCNQAGGDLNCCCVNWELLHYSAAAATAQTITVNQRKNHFYRRERHMSASFLERILLKRSSPSFVLAAIREIYKVCDQSDYTQFDREETQLILCTLTEFLSSGSDIALLSLSALSVSAFTQHTGDVIHLEQ
ncbi:uncharacterized protein AKAME5_001926700 [Lates japonicus]|uniref:Uncharacterized protein n=1 Tax=Lates japonicus TaxID=270547 RepID=A0AAD3N9G4_LATJO|nr:uncharacterized protein AKAME5_001926700 [Lates japonicus]